MRLRTFATAAILGVTLLPPSLAAAVRPANVTVERAQLRALMTQRRALVEQLAAADGPRGQLLTLHALVAADAILSADAAALQRRDALSGGARRAVVAVRARHRHGAAPGHRLHDVERPGACLQRALVHSRAYVAHAHCLRDDSAAGRRHRPARYVASAGRAAVDHSPGGVSHTYATGHGDRARDGGEAILNCPRHTAPPDQHADGSGLT
ncbi:MAG: hypothetical protein LC769_09310 [Chloroflexi bacterium]|nr:hypothetical protein [Chloroflexota bacterium]